MCFGSRLALSEWYKKWKRRFFVLFKPSGSLPGQYELSYFNDEQFTKKKGSIDLELCEQIIESLDSEQFPYLLAIKTYCRGKERTYFLAADTEDEMAAWVMNLCGACDLKQEESPTDIPPESIPKKLPLVQSSSVTSSLSANGTGHATTAQPLSQHRNPPPPSFHSSTAESYIPLTSCRSGSQKQRDTLPAFERRESVDSVPDELAPPPPDKGHKSNAIHDNHDDSVFHQDLYDVPPTHNYYNQENLYKVPPPRHTFSGHSDDFAFEYDVPPRRGSPSTPRSSDSDKASLGRPMTPQDTYDIPPPRPVSSGSCGSGGGSNPDQPPMRPPKPVSMQPSIHMHVPKNSKLYTNDLSRVITVPKPPERPPVLLDQYDVPRGSSGNTNLNMTPPPPKTCNSVSVHKYLNAADGLMEARDSAYIPMSNSDADKEIVYTDMDAVHTDMRMSDARLSQMSSLYQSPPRVVPRPVISAGLRAPPCPNPDPETTQAQIWSSQRTKSFKRNELHHINHSPSSLPRGFHNKSMLLSKYDMPSSSDDDDDEFGVHIPPFMGAVPPAPLPEDKELKYLDLELDEIMVETSSRSPSSSHASQSAPTEYREIDFVKTQALNKTKQWKDEHMRHDEH